ncbi:stalk domain-containing protein [Paenibacillus gansuensis]|uniref:Stalk domain-containing protein n=1 Tax=Paenibacillus gansuensis TaxID=306542 RepID=A0ABW5PEN4_9BACL
MKRKVMGMMAASVMATSAITVSASAAVPAKSVTQPAAAITNAAAVVDGMDFTLRSVAAGQTTLVSVKDFAQAIGASVSYSKGVLTLMKDGEQVSFSIHSKTLTTADGEVEFAAAPVIVKGMLFAQWQPIAAALGLEVTENGQISTMKLLSGVHSLPRWAGANTAVVAHENEDGSVSDYLINLTDKYSVSLMLDAEADSVSVSPDGKWGIYAASNGNLFTVNLHSGEVKKISEDTESKSDLIWSQDGKKVFYIGGADTKYNTIYSVNLADGKLTKVVEDKVDYKSDLRANADGTLLAYLVNTQNTVKSDSKDALNENAVEVDSSTAGTQIYVADAAKKDGKGLITPEKLTTTPDNKLYIDLMKDGKVIYVSVDVEGTNDKATYKVVSRDKTVADFSKDLDVLVSTVTQDGNLVAVTVDNKIYKVEAATGTAALLYTSDADIYEISVNAQGEILANAGDQIVLIREGKAVKLTKE